MCLSDQVVDVKCRPCLGASLQHCVSTALAEFGVSEVTDVLAKCRSIAEYFGEGSDAAGQLETTQTELGLPLNNVEVDQPTRWNSTV